jgi:hypothetical protein
VKLLVVTYYYTPALSPRAFRWAALCEEWVRRGHEVTVVSAWSPGEAREEVLRGVRVHRVGGRFLEGVRRWLGHPSSVRAGGATPANGRRRGALAAAARWVHDHTWKKVYWPDFASPWVRPAYAAARHIVAREAPDALVTVSLPFSGHLVGLKLKRRHPELRWLVDVGDPFLFFQATALNNEALYRRRNEWVEARVFARADAVAVTTEPTRERYAALFPRASGRIHVLPPLLSVPEVEAPPPVPGTLRLVFVGVLFRRFRNPGFLLRIFHALAAAHPERRLELHFYGDLHDCGDCFAAFSGSIGRSVFLHGAVPRAEAYRAMLGADVLVNLANDSEFQLPSKVVDYASTRSPVLNVVRSGHDSSVRFFERHPAVFTLVDEGAEVTGEQIRAVSAFLEAWAGKRVPEAALAWLSAYRLDALADAYLDLVRTEGMVAA